LSAEIKVGYDFGVKPFTVSQPIYVASVRRFS
jgi:hypothetical protein